MGSLPPAVHRLSSSALGVSDISTEVCVAGAVVVVVSGAATVLAGVGAGAAEGPMGVAAAKASQLAPRRMSFMASLSMASNWDGHETESVFPEHTDREIAGLYTALFPAEADGSSRKRQTQGMG